MLSLFKVRYELSFIALSLLIGGLFFIDSRELPDPVYEPMGSAAFPSVIATVMLLLALLKMVQVLFSQSSHKEREAEDTHFARSLLMLLMFVAFVAMVGFLDVSLWISVSLFLASATFFLKKPRGSVSGVIQCLIILVFSLMLDYVGTQVLYLDI